MKSNFESSCNTSDSDSDSGSESSETSCRSDSDGGACRQAFRQKQLRTRARPGPTEPPAGPPGPSQGPARVRARVRPRLHVLPGMTLLDHRRTTVRRSRRLSRSHDCRSRDHPRPQGIMPVIACLVSRHDSERAGMTRSGPDLLGPTSRRQPDSPSPGPGQPDPSPSVTGPCHHSRCARATPRRYRAGQRPRGVKRAQSGAVGPAESAGAAGTPSQRWDGIGVTDLEQEDDSSRRTRAGGRT